MRARVEIVPYEIPLRIPMRTSVGSTDVRSGLFLRVRDEDHGIVGLGETAPLDSGELALAREVIEQARASSLEMQGEPARPDGLLSRVAAAVEHWLGADAPPSARCGLETACLDLLARRQGRTVAELLGAVGRTSVEVNALITDDDADVVRERTADFIARGFRTLKLKVGDRERDLARIRAVLAAAGPGGSSAEPISHASAPGPCTLRLDANRGWDFASASASMRELAGMPIDYVEEPLSEPLPHLLARLRRTSLVGIALDESISTVADFDRFAGVGACDVLVIKLQRVGGPSAAFRLAESARTKRLRVVFTDSLETAVGCAATLHCAAACTSEAVGLAGAFLMSGDDGPHARPLVELVGPGLGITP